MFHGSILVELAEVEQILKIAREARYSKDEQSSKQLLRGLAHEIKNPLGGIKGSLLSYSRKKLMHRSTKTTWK